MAIKATGLSILIERRKCIFLRICQIADNLHLNRLPCTLQPCEIIRLRALVFVKIILSLRLHDYFCDILHVSKAKGNFLP